MNQKKFIELLNLFVDHEISSVEAAELEQEIALNPERRKIYQQYCRIQRGSGMLAESFKSEGAPAGSKLARAARDADDKVARFPERRATQISWGWISGLGVAAAAACVALVVVKTDGSGKTAAPSASPVVAQRMISPGTAVSPSPQSLSVAPRFRPTLVAQALPQNVMGGSYATAAASSPSLDWMDRVDMPSVRSIPVEDLLFDAKPGLQQESKTFRSGRPMQTPVEMSAFQFQK